MSTPTKYHRLDREQRRQQILDVANDLFAERGYEEVSVEDIASAAGVTRGLVHHYFGGRRDVYIALLERIGTVARRCGHRWVAALEGASPTRCRGGSTGPRRIA